LQDFSRRMGCAVIQQQQKLVLEFLGTHAKSRSWHRFISKLGGKLSHVI
jgi:hypothetical protein